MVKLINKDTRVIVQGITGTQGRFHAARMKEYGTKVVAGVTPGRGGQLIDGTPVYDTVIEAKEKHSCDASIIFVPAIFALDATLEAIEANIDPVVVITEGLPVRDAIELVARAKQFGLLMLREFGTGGGKIEVKVLKMKARKMSKGLSKG